VSALAGQLDDYLRLRRGLGFQLGQHGSVLPGFVAYAAASGAETVTVELAVTWARLPAGIKPITAGFRLSEVRGFARYLHAIDPAHEVPPPGLLGVPRRRPTPCIYTPGQIAEILRARPSGYSHRCGRPPTGRCSACWQRRACAWGRRRR